MNLVNGDRIRLLAMPQDPCPIPVGTEGTVTSYRYPRLGRDLGDGSVIHGVRWDNGRMLSIILPVDKVEKIDV